MNLSARTCLLMSLLVAAPVVPIAVWLGDARRVRRRYQVKVGAPLCIPETLDLDSAAAWLREQTLHLYAAAEQIT